MNLVAKGYSSLDGVTPMYLWNSGNYKECEVFDSSYDKALDKFKELVGNSFEYVSLC